MDFEAEFQAEFQTLTERLQQVEGQLAGLDRQLLLIEKQRKGMEEQRTELAGAMAHLQSWFQRKSAAASALPASMAPTETPSGQRDSSHTSPPPAGVRPFRMITTEESNVDDV